MRIAAFVRGRKLAQASAALVVTTALMGIPAGPANATEADCDSTAFDSFQNINSATIFAYGRTVHLLNGYSSQHSYARIYGGYQPGDLVWVDRSINPMPSSVPTYFSDDSYVTSRGGWKQCGPFNDRITLQVTNWDMATQEHFAVRACFRPKDGQPSVCGSWYVDRVYGY